MSGSRDVPRVDPDTLAALRNHLLVHSVRTGHFTLKSGRTSTWFIDSKQTVCRPEAMVLGRRGRAGADTTRGHGHRWSHHGGRPRGLRHRRRGGHPGRPLKAFSVRKEAKDHGAGGRIAGALDPEDRVVVTEDTVTRGTSLLEAARVCATRARRSWPRWRWSTGAERPRRWRPREGIPFFAVLRAPDLGFPFEGA